MIFSSRLVSYILVLDLLVKVTSISSSHQTASPTLEIDMICLDETSKTKCFNRDDPKTSNETLLLFPVFGENHTLVFNDDQDILVGIACKASFPVEWIHLQEKWLGSESEDWVSNIRSHSYTYRRIVKTLEDVSSFIHQTTLFLHNMQMQRGFSYAVGRYTCQSSESFTSTRPVAHMSIFKERKIYEKTLPLSGRNITVWTNEENDGTIVFPCYASYQNATVNLYKKGIRKLHKWLPISGIPNNIIETWDIILPSDKLEYRADQGFIYYKNKLPISYPVIQFAPGTYKCAIVDEDNGTDEEQPVMINLQEGYGPLTEEKPVHDTISRGAFLNYTTFQDIKGFRLICCSNSLVPPDVYLTSCTSKTMCDRHQRIFAKLEMKSPVPGANQLTTVKSNCRQSLNISFALDFPITVRCIGDGVNYINTVVFPLENNTLDNNGIQPYERWEDIDPLKMITLIPLKWDKRNSDDEVILYNNQNITFQCDSNRAYFEIESRVTINFKNGKRQLLKYETKLKSNFFITKTVIITLTVRKDIESISCHAPALNSNEWITKTLKFQVMDGEAVSITDSNVVDEVYWTLNEKSKVLKCQFSGDPPPEKVEWRKDSQVQTLYSSATSTLSKVIQFSNNTNAQFAHSMVTKNTSILLISSATYDTHGVYDCVIGNIYGNVTKEFRVIVRAPESNWIIFSASLGLICLAIILLILRLCMRRQRKLLNVCKNTVLIKF